MSKVVALDEIDEKIIKEFQKNGRLSNSAVGRELGLSEGLVRKRMKRMIDAGAISYGLVVDIKATDMAAFGWLNVRAAAARARAVADTISSMKLCSLCVVATSEFNVRAYMYAKDLEAMTQTTQTISQIEGVLEVHFRQAVTHTGHRYEYVVLPDETHRERWNVGE